MNNKSNETIGGFTVFIGCLIVLFILNSIDAVKYFYVSNHSETQIYQGELVEVVKRRNHGRHSSGYKYYGRYLFMANNERIGILDDSYKSFPDNVPYERKIYVNNDMIIVEPLDNELIGYILNLSLYIVIPVFYLYIKLRNRESEKEVSIE